MNLFWSDKRGCWLQFAVPCISVKVGRPLWKDRPSWFLVAEQDRMIIPDTQRFMAERMKAGVWSQPVDHTPIVTAPGVVVDFHPRCHARRNGDPHSNPMR
jgi:pimeloyl-ACP methyl ester carboxylesterase